MIIVILVSNMISYQQYSPHAALRDHIDAYWTSEAPHVGSQRIFPDACMDIIVNIGTAEPLVNERQRLVKGGSYLVGSMSVYSGVLSPEGSRLLGIRFKPGAMAAFYDVPVWEIADRIVEHDEKKLLSLIDEDEQLFSRLDQYFLQKLKPVSNRLFAITAQIERTGGNITMDALSRAHHITPRTLERLFKNGIGLPAKAVAGIIRFQQALRRIRQNPSGESMLRIAVEAGYYDHAHLAKDLKTYTGLNPSALAV